MKTTYSLKNITPLKTSDEFTLNLDEKINNLLLEKKKDERVFQIFIGFLLSIPLSIIFFSWFFSATPSTNQIQIFDNYFILQNDILQLIINAFSPANFTISSFVLVLFLAILFYFYENEFQF
ncbi:MAG: hypothetical protein AAB255_00215 [Bacteroidota bacterium]